MRILGRTAMLSALLMLLWALSGCNDIGREIGRESGGDMEAEDGDRGDEHNIEVPKRITVMVDGTVTSKANNRDAFEKRWEELTGIDIEFIQPDHAAYYDVVAQTFASGMENWPDAIILSPSYYTGYAAEGVLWDMTEAWESSELRKSGRVRDESVIDGMRIGERLYGFPVSRGNGCVSYVKKKWLENTGLELPTSYDEYINMLRVFSEEDPDGNGIKGDTYGASFPGIISGEAPFVNYAPEFYQDAYPSFIKGEDGVWRDGFMEESFKEALKRFQEAYKAGYIDKESLTNSTRDCRNKFYEDRFGVFTYWAGNWALKMKNNLLSNGLDGELVAIPPIKELGSYIERNPPVWAITRACNDPEGVYRYLIESMLDGGDMQLLWTYGVEDVHWSVKEETVLGKEYSEGEFHLKNSIEKPETQYTRQHLDPVLSIAEWRDNPGSEEMSGEVLYSQELFNKSCRQAQLVPSTDIMASLNGDLLRLKRDIIADIVVLGLTVDEGYESFEKKGGVEWSNRITASLNALETSMYNN